MKKPAIRSKIGSWTYYLSTLTFNEVSSLVEKIDDQLHKSTSLKGLIQRSLTENSSSIKEYILNQPEMFFNSLVLAIYNDSPKWVEVELVYGEENFYDLGFLDFSGTEKIFPVDGQHRVEGIKEALKENPEFEKEKIGVIFIGHSKEPTGMQKSRRLFTTLNRYAKPVTLDDIIALDEDDIIAIVTRHLLEEFDLFTESRVTKSKSKAIIENDKKSITSIITLYQCNKELLKLYRKDRKLEYPNPERDKISIKNYLKFRPNQEEIDLFLKFCKSFWQSFIDGLSEIQDFVKNTSDSPAASFRNKEYGGNLLFRPVGLLPFIQVILEIHKRSGEETGVIIKKFNHLNFKMNTKPWENVLWNPNDKTMIMGNQALVKLILIYSYDKNILNKKEIESLIDKYADKKSYMGVEKENLLKDLTHV